jgi:ERCC4-type nuclease
MVILEDQQEKKPLKFNMNWECLDAVERIHLKTGDYMVRFNDGYVPPICIERKSKADLYGTLTSGMRRFRNEVNRAIEAGYRFYLFIEESQEDCNKPLMYRKCGKWHKKKTEPLSIMRTLNTLEVKHGVIHKFYNSPEAMALAVYRLFYASGKLYAENLRKLKRELKDSKKAKELLD